MAVVTNAECRKLPDFATAYNWRVHFKTLPSGVTNGGLTKAQLNVLAKGAGIPKREANQAAEVTLHRHKVYVPGVEFSSGKWTCTVTELVTGAFKDMVRSWRELNHENGTGVAVEYSNAMGEIDLFQQSRQGVDVYKWTMKDCWIEDYDPGAEFDNGEGTTLFDSMQLMFNFNHLEEQNLS